MKGVCSSNFSSSSTSMSLYDSSYGEDWLRTSTLFLDFEVLIADYLGVRGLSGTFSTPATAKEG